MRLNHFGSGLVMQKEKRKRKKLGRAAAPRFKNPRLSMQRDNRGTSSKQSGWDLLLPSQQAGLVSICRWNGRPQRRRRDVIFFAMKNKMVLMFWPSPHVETNLTCSEMLPRTSSENRNKHIKLILPNELWGSEFSHLVPRLSLKLWELSVCDHSGQQLLPLDWRCWLTDSKAGRKENPDISLSYCTCPPPSSVSFMSYG